MFHQVVYKLHVTQRTVRILLDVRKLCTTQLFASCRRFDATAARSIPVQWMEHVTGHNAKSVTHGQCDSLRLPSHPQSTATVHGYISRRNVDKRVKRSPISVLTGLDVPSSTFTDATKAVRIKPNGGGNARLQHNASHKTYSCQWRQTLAV